MTLTVPERVAAGAAWLDENKPGWVDLIDLDRLRLINQCYCVLGQVFGSYQIAPEEALYEQNTSVATDRGFDAIRARDRFGAWDFEAIEADFDALTSEWYRLVEARRAVTR